jgi:23S rRNA U2552 (ribose-2'-O)-methylase RlmE/FtsJ
MHFFEGLSKTNPKMRTAHVAEGPGGFIQAVLHLAERHKKIVTQATAMTLKPTDSYVPGWRRATNFLHHNRQVKLHYGQDGTGDIYIPANQTSFIEAVRPGVHIFTADGGFDFSVDYSVQEFKVFRLLVCSALVGIQSLLQDGVFILKVFDSFSESTQILLVVLSRCFKEWALYKPLLSRPCNSERYFIGRGFKGVTTSMLQTLKRMQYECETNGVYPRGVRDLATEDEMAYLEQNTRESIGAQLYYLARAEQFALKPEIWYEKQMAADFQMSLAWCSRYRIPTRYVSPVTLTAPPLISSECISGQGVGQQSQLPGDGSGCLVPCDQA